MTDEILIQNRTARVLGPTYEGDAQEPQILRLMPGVNRVPRKAWDKVTATKNPLIDTHLEQELLIVLDDKAELAAMPLSRAVAVVSETYDKAILRGWVQKEDRKPVLAAIQEQLERLDGSKPDEEEEEPGPQTLSPSSPLQPAGGVDVTRPRGGGRKKTGGRRK